MGSQHSDSDDDNIIYIRRASEIMALHRVMSAGLNSFTGTNFEQYYDPSTSMPDNRVMKKLYLELKENAPKLRGAKRNEKMLMVYLYDSIPGRLPEGTVKYVQWGRKNKLELYDEYVEKAFCDYARACADISSDPVGTISEYMKVVYKMQDEYNKELREQAR